MTTTMRVGGDVRARQLAAGLDLVVLGADVGRGRAGHRDRGGRGAVVGGLTGADDRRDGGDVGGLGGIFSCETSAAVMVAARIWVPAVDGPRPNRPRLTMVMVLVPSSLMRFWTAWEDPVPTATRMITAPTPMRMPRTVRAERSLLADNPRRAARTLSGQVTRPAAWMNGVRISARARGVGEDEPVANPDHPLGVAGDVRLVGDEHHGAPGGVQVGEDRHHVLARVGVQVAGRLVGEDQRRVGDDGPGDRHPLLLAARHLARQVTHAVGHADLGQGRLGPLAAGFGSDPGVGQGKLDVGQRSRARDQIEALKDEADLPVAHLGQRQLVEVAHVDAVEPVPARRRGCRGSR